MPQTWDVTLLPETEPSPGGAAAFPFRLHITITLPNGQEYRWAPDEHLVENQFTGLTFTSTVPGGFSTCTFTLPRDLIRDYPDEALFADVKVTGAGGVTAWEGRVVSLPREHGSARSVTVGAVGHYAALKDNQGFREVYVDSALSSWRDMPYLNEKARIAAAVHDWTALSFQQDNGAWTCALPDQALSTGTTAGLWYEMPAGCTISRIEYQGDENLPTFTGLNGRAFEMAAADQYAAAESLAATNDDTLRTLTPTTARRYVAAFVYVGTGGTPAAGQYVAYKKLAVYGDHGVTVRSVAGGTSGVYLSDLVADIIPRCAPSLTVGDVEDTSFPITQASYPLPTDGESVLMDLNKFEQKRMGVWEDREFTMWTASPLTRTVWEARLSEGAQLQLEGDNADSVANGVIVQYADPYGVPRTIGPTGYTYADTTSDELLITDESNAATAAGLQKYQTLSLSFQTDASGAEQIGAVWLREQQLPQRRGSITLTGLVQHPTRGRVPCWQVRAGDFIRIADRPNDPPREVTSASYGHDGHTVTLAVGGLPASVEALLERVGIRTVN